MTKKEIHVRIQFELPDIFGLESNISGSSFNKN